MFSPNDFDRGPRLPLLWLWGPILLGAVLITALTLAVRATQGFPNIELADAIRQAPEDKRADQHADEEHGPRLQCLRHRQSEGFCDRRCRKTDRQHLHRVGQPHQAEDEENAVLKLADAGGMQRLFHRYGNAVSADCAGDRVLSCTDRRAHGIS